MMGFLTAPRFCFGPQALEQLSSLDLHRVALVVAPPLRAGARVLRIQEEVAKTDARAELFDGPPGEPTLEGVEALAVELRRFGPDWIVAVGGGSVLDGAKGAWARYERPELSLPEITPMTELKLRTRARFVAVPTTAGSGSESNGMVHLHRPDGPLLEIGSRELEPDWALLDPGWLETLTPQQLAWGGGDALVHALEAVASEWSSPFTDAMAREAIGRLLKDLPRVRKGPVTPDLFQSIQAAAALAGLAAGNAQSGAIHALAHALQAAAKLPHAPAAAALIPYVLEYNFDAARERFQGLQPILGAGPVQDRHALAARFRTFAEQAGLPRTLEQAGLAPDRFRAERDRILAFARSAPALVGNPRLPSSEELARLLDDAVRGGPEPRGAAGARSDQTI
ncbi:MAG: iron-containing alcohol dehydrogenase [Thermoplasmata archaeon]